MEKRKVLVVFFIALWAVLAFPKVQAQRDLNLIYIHLDAAMNYDKVWTECHRLLRTLEDSKYYVVFANGEEVKRWDNNTLKKGELESYIKQNTNYTPQIPDIKDALLDFCKVNKISVLQSGRMVRNPEYESVKIYGFVGRSFFETGYQDEVFAKLFVSSGLQGDLGVEILYYASLDTLPLGMGDVQFGPFYKDLSIKIALR